MAFGNSFESFGGTPGKKEERCAWIETFNSYYNKKNVLIGNWCENRIKPQNNQTDFLPVYDGTNPLSSETEYKENYKPRNNSSHVAIQEEWDEKFKEEDERLTLLGRQEEYINNMASSYDLQYRYCIKEKFNSEIADRRPDSCLHEGPNIDYSLSYGNPTQFGLREYKKFLWQQEKNDKKHVRTTYQMSYGCPITTKQEHHYKFGMAPNVNDLIAVDNKKIYHGNTSATNHNIQTYVPLKVPGRSGAYMRCG